MQGISDYLIYAADTAIRLFWPEADPTFPPWLYEITDVQWVALIQLFMLLVLGWRYRALRRAFRRCMRAVDDLCADVGASHTDIQMRIERLRVDVRRVQQTTVLPPDEFETVLESSLDDVNEYNPRDSGHQEGRK